MAIYSNQASSNQYITIELETRVDSQSVENNTTTVSWWLRVRKSGSSTSDTWGNCSYAANIGGNAYSGSGQVRVSPGGATSLLSGTTTVAHNSDGSMTLSLSGSISGKITGSVSATQTLDTIPRGSAMTIDGGTIGSKVVLHISAESDAFRHRVVYTFGSASEWVLDDKPSGWYEWYPPESLAEQIPNAVSGAGKLQLITYSGDNVIAAQDFPITLSVPDDMVPSISDVAFSEAESVIAKQFGVYVQGKSRLNVKISASGAYGSKIWDYATSVGGVKYSGQTVTTNTITTYGVVPVYVSVTDTRGRTASTEVTVHVEGYQRPTIKAFAVNRATKSGVYQEDSDYVLVEYSYAISEVDQKNTHAVTIEYKRSTESEWTTLLTDPAYSKETSVVPDTAFSNDFQYDFRLIVADYFTSDRRTVSVLSAKVILDLYASGDGLSLGKTAELENVFDVGYDTKFRGKVTLGDNQIGDIMTETGTYGDWSYVKCASGLAMMWCNVTAEYSAASVLEKWVSYPFTLQAGVAAFGTLESVGSNSGAALGWNVKVVPQSDNQIARVFVHNPSGSFGGADALTVSVLVLGRWK